MALAEPPNPERPQSGVTFAVVQRAVALVESTVVQTVQTVILGTGGNGRAWLSERAN